MQYRLKTPFSKYLIDTSEGRVYRILTRMVKKVEVEYLTKEKKFTHIQEAYEYLSQTERMPVWRLKANAKPLEVEK